MAKGLNMNNLYEFTIKVLRGENAEMPDGVKGAYVVCCAAASDYQAALKKGVLAVTQMGYKFDDIKNGVRDVPLGAWGDYLAKVWPEYADQLPSVSQLPELVKGGQVFFGPFAGFSS